MEKYTRETKLELPKLSPEQQAAADTIVRDIRALEAHAESLTAQLEAARTRFLSLRRERAQLPRDASAMESAALREKLTDERIAIMEVTKDLQHLAKMREDLQLNYRHVVFGEGGHNVH